MNEANPTPRRVRRWAALLALPGLFGCGCGPVAGLVIKVLILAGSVLITSAAARAGEVLIDRLMSNKQEAQFQVDPNNPSRGTCRDLTFKTADGKHAIKCQNVPVYKDSQTGLWKVDPNYARGVEDGLAKQQ